MQYSPLLQLITSIILIFILQTPSGFQDPGQIWIAPTSSHSEFRANDNGYENGSRFGESSLGQDHQFMGIASGHTRDPWHVQQCQGSTEDTQDFQTDLIDLCV